MKESFPSVESKEKAKFEIGRRTVHEFEPYAIAETEVEATAKWREMVGANGVSNPDEIRIFEVGGKQPRTDLEVE